MPNILVCGNGIVAVHGGIPTQDIENLFSLKGNEMLFDGIRWNDPRDYDFERIPGRGGGGTSEFGVKPFERFMEAIGGSVMVRGHEPTEGKYALMFNSRLLTIFSTGRGSQETGYPQVSQPIFTEFDLTKPITKISQENIHPIQY